MDQMKIIFKTVQGLKSVAEEEIGVEPNLLALADRQSVENLEERLRSSPDLKNQLVRTSGQLQEKKKSSLFYFANYYYCNSKLNSINAHVLSLHKSHAAQTIRPVQNFC